MEQGAVRRKRGNGGGIEHPPGAGIETSSVLVVEPVGSGFPESPSEVDDFVEDDGALDPAFDRMDGESDAAEFHWGDRVGEERETWPNLE